METKKQIIEKIKTKVKLHAQPRGMNSRSKKQLQEIYADAERLGLIIKKPLLVQIGQSFYSLKKEFEIDGTKELKQLIDSNKYVLRLLLPEGD